MSYGATAVLLCDRLSYFATGGNLSANELQRISLIVKKRASLPVTMSAIRKKLGNATERGNFLSPMGIIQRMRETVRDFGDAANRVLSASGHEKSQIRVETLPAALVVIEAIKEYHWRTTKHLAVVRNISLADECVRLLREYVQ